MAYKRTSPQPVQEGGTGRITLTNHSVLVGAIAGPITQLAVGTNGQVLTGVTGADPVFAAPAASSISLTGDSGGALTGAAFTITGGTTGHTFAGAGTTLTLGGTLVVANGGTGRATLTNHGVLVGAGTTAITQLAVGTTGQVLTGVTGADPVFAAPAASSISITGDTGGALVGAAFTFSGGTTGLSFGGAGTTETLTFAGITANGGTVSLATDATTSTINVGTGAGVKTSTFGSTNSTSATTIQSGSGALNVTATNGAITINSGTGTIALSSDATNTTVNLATGAGAKLTTLGSTNGASSLALKYGTADMTLASATGNVMSALDTGEITYPLQPAFLAYLATADNDQTGNGGVYNLGTVTALTEVFDQNADFNTNGTFTAPVTGRYFLNAAILVSGCTIATQSTFQIITSNRSYVAQFSRPASSGSFGNVNSALTDMDAADTATVRVVVAGEAANTADIAGSASLQCYFTGSLDC